jgi:putative N6-adenine-specific DNA methylase
VYLYQTEARYFAQIPDGAEEVAASELSFLGAREVKPGYRGLYFGADPAALYAIVYRALTITRVLAPILRFQCHSADYLYKRAQDVRWRDFISPKGTFAVFATVSNSAIRHSQYAGLRVKDAIVDQFRAETGARPNVDTTQPDVWVNLYLHANKATLSIDASGGSMHRRGYRVESVEAPMQETVAAAMLAMTEWDGTAPLVDPMCGSGTILCEALMRYCRVPAGYRRQHFGFERLPDFDRDAWQRVKQDADGAIRELPAGLIRGSDAASEAARAARRNLAQLPGGRDVVVEHRRFELIDRIEGAAICTNPPYGMRIGRRDQMPEFIRSFGDFLKQRCAGSTAFVYFGNRELLKSLGLRPAWRKPLANGGLDGRLVRVDLFAGERSSVARSSTS